MFVRERGPGAKTCVAMMVLFIAGLVALGVRLREIQVNSAAEYLDAGERQSVRKILTSGIRGRILDRNGVVLADNRHRVSIVCDMSAFRNRSYLKTSESVVKAVESLRADVGLEGGPTFAAVTNHLRIASAMPLVIWRDVGQDAIERFCEHALRHPGFSLSEDLVRHYSAAAPAANLIGFVGSDTQTGKAGGHYNFRQGDMCGRSGLESFYDAYLRGVPGEDRRLVDALGYTIREWTVVPPGRGPDLWLSLDSRIQRAAEAQMAGLYGACVVMDATDGGIIALVSAPGISAAELSGPRSALVYAQARSDNQGKPLFNRAVGGLFAPGSTFKPITALAGLSVGWPADEQYECIGAFQFGDMHLRCASRWGHGPLNMREALRDSCNPYFCNLGAESGSNAVIVAARKMGLGKKTGIDFPLDSAGVVPDDAWKRARYHERWYPGDLVQMSIGQGMLMVTPLQMARVAAAIGTGYLPKPRLKWDLPSEREQVRFPQGDLDIVREGMRMVADGGTGRRGASGVNAWVIGKTGTAEVGSRSNRRKNTWFIAYAEDCAFTASGKPSRLANPSRRVAVALLVENGESGGGTAAPKVAEILKAIFGQTAEACS